MSPSPLERLDELTFFWREHLPEHRVLERVDELFDEAGGYAARLVRLLPLRLALQEFEVAGLLHHLVHDAARVPPWFRAMRSTLGRWA